jgi:phosphonate transport system ATP-binding protein
VIEIIGLSKTYGPRVTALRDVSLCVKRGEFAVLLGPSGSGKSTLLRCINGLVEPSAGTIRVDGVQVTGSGLQRRAVRRRIGMVFQGFNLIKALPVLHNVLVGRLGQKPLFHGWIFTTAEREMALDALDRVGLAGKAGVRAGSLSGGEQQRVGIARALVQRPDVILADEPVASLDPVTAQETLSLLREIHRTQGVTILCSLHQVGLARQFAERVFGLARGRLVFEGEGAALDERDLVHIYGDGHAGGPGGPPSPRPRPTWIDMTRKGGTACETSW